ncbi:MAG: spheroidene monooxygenase [Bordetella sp.]
MHTVVVILSRLRPSSVGWAVSRLVLSAFGPARWPGLVFQKVLGSGEQGGFGLRPGLDHQGLFTVFNTTDAAHQFLESAPQVKAYQDRSDEFFAAVLYPLSSRGQWSGFSLEPSAPKDIPNNTKQISPSSQRVGSAPQPGFEQTVASLTRASIRPFKARRFWAQSPDAEDDLRQARGCLLAVGLGEAPLLRQATFSLWENQAAMDAYARSGAHQRAIQAAYGQKFFSESMFVRFHPLRLEGQWRGELFGDTQAHSQAARAESGQPPFSQAPSG